jgi:hypothetical protein
MPSWRRSSECSWRSDSLVAAPADLVARGVAGTPSAGSSPPSARPRAGRGGSGELVRSLEARSAREVVLRIAQAASRSRIPRGAQPGPRFGPADPASGTSSHSSAAFSSSAGRPAGCRRRPTVQPGRALQIIAAHYVRRSTGTTQPAPQAAPRGLDTAGVFEHRRGFFRIAARLGQRAGTSRRTFTIGGTISAASRRA